MGAAPAIVHAKPLRPTYAALFEAALDRCVPGQLPDNIQAEVALWALVCPYNSALGDADTTTLREDLTISDLKGSLHILRRCLFAGDKAPEGTTRSGVGVDAPRRLRAAGLHLRDARARGPARAGVDGPFSRCAARVDRRFTTSGEDGARALFKSGAAAQARDDGVDDPRDAGLILYATSTTGAAVDRGRGAFACDFRRLPLNSRRERVRVSQHPSRDSPSVVISSRRRHALPLA